MPTKAERLAAWKAKKAAAAAGTSTSPKQPSAVSQNPTPTQHPISTTTKAKPVAAKLSLKRKGKPSKAPPPKKINTAFGDDEDDDSDEDKDSGKAAGSRPSFFDDDNDDDEEEENGASAMDVDDGNEKDALDAYMTSTLDKSELVEQDTSAIGSKSTLPPPPTNTVITLDDIIEESKTVNEDLDDKQTSTLLKVLTGEEESDPAGKDAPEADQTAAVIDDLKKKAAEAIKAREQRVEIGRLFGSDDGPEESERLLELYEQDGLSRNAEKVMINKKKFIADVDHASIDYIKVIKNLYVPKERLRVGKNGLNNDEVQEMRRKIDVKVRGAGVIPVPVSTFEESGLSPRVLDILSVRMKITTPFPIQAQCLPCIMSGRDVIGIAKTGSGKTLAFVLPLLRHIMSQPPLDPGESGPIGLILAPARELALQIADVAKKFCKHLNLKSSCVYGGGAVAEQIGELKRGAEIVVATPGRLIDILTMQAGKVLSLRRVSYVVMDEADRMFDMGFEPQISSILKAVRPDRQICLFSATFPKSVEGLARNSLKYPVEIMVGGRSVASDTIEQYAEVIPEQNKFRRLLQLLGLWVERGKVIVFVDTQTKCDSLYQELVRSGYPCLSLHGGKEQEERDETISDFRDTQSTFSVLVATSVAGRGLDVPTCRLVINYSSPNHLEDYVHRVGRTGRAGRNGTAYTFVNDEDEAAYSKIVIKALSDAGWKKNVPTELRKLADAFDEKVKRGEARSANRGYGGRGFTYDGNEMNEKQKLEKIEKRQAMVDAGMIAEDDGVKEAADMDDDKDASQEQATSPKFAKPEGPLTGKQILEKATQAAAAAAKTETTASKPAAGSASTSPMPPSDASQAAAIRKAQAIAAKLGTSSANLMKLPGMENKLMGKSLTGGPAGVGPNGRSTGMVGTGMRRGQKIAFHVQDVEINDYCREARWKVTNKDSVSRLMDDYACAITNKGEVYMNGRKPDPSKGERKMYLSIEGTDPVKLDNCVKEVYRLMNEETIRVNGGTGGGSNRFSIV